ncbi:MAG: 4-(cytidine 5'-diphospho)-2-C-methyl-D-erythritol kinase [Candidatus Marinimicrobia bacterium]|nr:4-(cytidine 5'-diphospho)-2-C-methyl-D-erythritol kinase [Candidatus Neomarinimicrobiota bacterium]
MDRTSHIIRSNAKINLCLRITGKLSNGYHTLSTIFQEIDLHDIITFTPSRRYILSCSDPKVPCDGRNLCSKAYAEMKQLAPQSPDWHIHLQKTIPVGAGLGGGSSNAATVIKFLNEQWELGLDEQQLIRIAVKIGADVAFYIHGKTQGAEGIGEQLIPLKLPRQFTLLLICPAIHISTKWAYQQFNLTKRKEGYKFHDVFESGKIQWSLFENQFESVVFSTYPEIGNIKTLLIKEGSQYAGLSGSGSTVFGIFKNRNNAEHARKAFDRHTTFISTPIF